MGSPLPLQAWVSIGIAVTSLVVIPFVVHMFKQFLIARREAKAAELAKVLSLYLTKTEHDTNFERLERTQSQRHEENRDFLDTIRTEAHQREERIVVSINNLSARVDTIFERGALARRQKR